MPKRKDSATPSEDDFKPALSDEDVKPATKKSKSKPKSGAYPPGGKQALAELIIELGVKALPSNKEVAKMTGLSASQVTTQLDPRSGVRCNLNKYAKTLG